MVTVKNIATIVALSAMNYSAIVFCEYGGSQAGFLIHEHVYGLEATYAHAEACISDIQQTRHPVAKFFFAGIEASVDDYLKMHESKR